jgi:hypothetical protein
VGVVSVEAFRRPSERNPEQGGEQLPFVICRLLCIYFIKIYLYNNPINKKGIPKQLFRKYLFQKCIQNILQ